jgi:hypothetical protein
MAIKLVREFKQNQQLSITPAIKKINRPSSAIKA